MLEVHMALQFTVVLSAQHISSNQNHIFKRAFSRAAKDMSAPLPILQSRKNDSKLLFFYVCNIPREKESYTEKLYERSLLSVVPKC